MLKLATPKNDTFWLDILPGVRVEFAPVTVVAMVAARRAGAEIYRLAALENPTAVVTEDLNARANVAVTRAIAVQGIKAWEGIGDAEGVPTEPSPATIDLLLEHWPAYQSIDSLYVAPAFTGPEANASEAS